MSWLNNVRTIFADDIKERYKVLRDTGIFSVENIIAIFEGFSRWVGYEVYERDTERWNYPTNGYGSNGFLDSLERIEQWIGERIAYLDSLYNYE